MMTNMIAISVNTAQRLYWFGRYVQRAETMLRELVRSYDYVIDRDVDDGRKLYAKLGVNIEYSNALDFLKQGVYGTYGGSIEEVISWARENAIETRHLLDERGFATLNRIYNQLVARRNHPVSPSHLEEIIDDCSLILGIFSTELDRTRAYQLIRFGQQIERLDLIVRLYGEIERVTDDIDMINSVARQLNQHYSSINVTTTDRTKFLLFLNDVVNSVIIDETCVMQSQEE